MRCQVRQQPQLGRGQRFAVAADGQHPDPLEPAKQCHRRRFASPGPVPLLEMPRHHLAVPEHRRRPGQQSVSEQCRARREIPQLAQETLREHDRLPCRRDLAGACLDEGADPVGDDERDDIAEVVGVGDNARRGSARHAAGLVALTEIQQGQVRQRGGLEAGQLVEQGQRGLQQHPRPIGVAEHRFRGTQHDRRRTPPRVHRAVARRAHRLGVPNHVVHPAGADQRTQQRHSDFDRRRAVGQRGAAVGARRPHQRALDRRRIAGGDGQPRTGDGRVGVLGHGALVQHPHPAGQESAAAVEAQPHRLAAHQGRGVPAVPGAQGTLHRGIEIALPVQHPGGPPGQHPKPGRVGRVQPMPQKVAEQAVVAVPNPLGIKGNHEEVARTANLFQPSRRIGTGEHLVQGCTGKSLQDRRFRQERHRGRIELAEYLLQEVVGQQRVAAGQRDGVGAVPRRQRDERHRRRPALAPVQNRRADGVVAPPTEAGKDLRRLVFGQRQIGDVHLDQFAAQPAPGRVHRRYVATHQDHGQ